MSEAEAGHYFLYSVRTAQPHRQSVCLPSCGLWVEVRLAPSESRSSLTQGDQERRRGGGRGGDADKNTENVISSSSRLTAFVYLRVCEV